jgi:hypothetical protein
MPAPTVCTVTGTLRDSAGSALSGATIQASCLRPYVHPTDSSLIVDYVVTTTTASDGTWSLNLVETTTPAVTVTIEFIYSQGATNGQVRKVYTVTIPNSSSATFASLVGTQV